MSQKESWSIITPEEASHADSVPPPYDDRHAGNRDGATPNLPAKNASSTGADDPIGPAAPVSPSIFCCPHLPELAFVDSPPQPATPLSNHPTSYTTRWLRQINSDSNIDIKYNRFFLWAGYGITGDSSTKDGRGKSKLKTNPQTFNIPWMYTVEVLDYRDQGAEVKYFVSLDQRKGFEPFPYGRGNGIRNQNLDLKSSMLLKCTKHDHFFEVNFYW